MADSNSFTSHFIELRSRLLNSLIFILLRYIFKSATYQEGYIEELSTCFYLDTALLKSSESVLSET